MEYRIVVCPVDDSELSHKGEDAAAYICKLSGARLILLHVVEKWYQSAHVVTDSKEWQTLHDEWLNTGRELLEKEEARLREKGVINIETVLREGDAPYEIIAVAKERKADVIVMATQHYSAVGRLFMGSVIDRVTKKAPCPVLWIF